MTSTSINVGLNGGRLSSRVLRPPGGGHTDIFGGELPPPRTVRRHMVANGEPEKQMIVETPSENGQDNMEAQPAENTEENCAPEPLAEAVEATASTEPPLVPQPAQEPTPAAVQKPKVITSGRRGRVPPGGFSTKLW